MSSSSLPPPSPRTFLVLLTLAGFLCHVSRGQLPCPHNVTSPVLDDKVAGSEVLVQGRVTGKVKVSSTSTAEVDVECVLKGAPVDARVKVSWTHYSDGRCPELGAGLMKGRAYLLYLNRGDGDKMYTLTFKPDPAERKYLEELKYACGLHVQLPEGVTESQICVAENFEADYPLEHCDDSGSPASVGSALPALLMVVCSLLYLTL